MKTRQVFLLAFLLVKPSLQILADGSAATGNPIIQPTTAQVNLSQNNRPDLYLPNFGPNGVGFPTTQRDALGFLRHETPTPSTLLMQNTALQSATVKAPEKIEGIIELLKTFSGNSSTDQQSLKKNPDEKVLVLDSKDEIVSSKGENQGEISQYLQKEQENLLNVIHNTKIESEAKSTSISSQTSSSSLISTNPTTPLSTTTEDHVQIVLESKDLKNQLLERLLAKEIQRGREDALLKIVTNLGVTAKIRDPSTIQPELAEQPLERSMNTQQSSSDESTNDNQNRKLNRKLYEIPFYK